MNGKKLSWITLWLILVCVLLVVSGTYAAYSSVQYRKGVAVAKAESEDLRFSSNYLSLRSRDDSTPLSGKLISASGLDSVSVAVTVCNYPQNDHGKYHNSDITYTLSATLLDADGNPLGDKISYQNAAGETVEIEKSVLLDQFRVNDTAFTTETISFASQTLAGSASHLNVYSVVCTMPALLNVVSIQMEAVPVSCSDNDCTLGTSKLIERLSIAVVERSAQTWKGHYIEALNNSTQVDAFNYEIYGTAVSSVTLTWEPAYVAPSQWTFADITATSTTTNSITFDVGGVGQPTSYRFQFYRTSAAEPNEDASAFIGFSSTLRTQAGAETG